MSYLNERAKQFFNSKIKDYLIKVEDGTEFINIKRTDLYMYYVFYHTKSLCKSILEVANEN